MIVRAIPAGSLEQVIFRVDALHRLARLGVAVINSPALHRAHRGQVLHLGPARGRGPADAADPGLRASRRRARRLRGARRGRGRQAPLRLRGAWDRAGDRPRSRLPHLPGAGGDPLGVLPSGVRAPRGTGHPRVRRRRAAAGGDDPPGRRLEDERVAGRPDGARRPVRRARAPEPSRRRRSWRRTTPAWTSCTRTTGGRS